MLDDLNNDQIKLLKDLFNQYIKNNDKSTFFPVSELHFDFFKSLQEKGYIIFNVNLDNCINDFIQQEQNQYLQIKFTDKFNKAFKEYKK